MKHRFSHGFLPRFLPLLASLIILLLLSASGQAETLRKRYTFDINPATRRASLQRAELLGKKQFLHDFLATKFSKEIVDNLSEDIDIALDPSDDYLLNWQVVSTKDEGDKVVITVEGDVDLPG